MSLLCRLILCYSIWSPLVVINYYEWGLIFSEINLINTLFKNIREISNEEIENVISENLDTIDIDVNNEINEEVNNEINKEY